MPYASLGQKVNEVFDGFLRFYPSYQEFRKEIIEVTEKHISQSLAAMSEETLNNYFFGHQLHADITVEITKQAMNLKEFTVPVRAIVRPEPLRAPQSLQAPQSLHSRPLPLYSQSPQYPKTQSYLPSSTPPKSSYTKRTTRFTYEK
ncbi:hypothetical protein Desdi_0467 [Desulfitobacterium dichloroeliminans LMG P-21439]|uniref:Uncharacterized protein n=2 Tax=Desulfitobacterium dichloroeliminans TaxID=233055 RepID=L0F4S1_DESDL|nr:hypothetical protein Desdi_0467 [Desulfitobacterium dichloroeliminans LMG P-21439]